MKQEILQEKIDRVGLTVLESGEETSTSAYVYYYGKLPSSKTVDCSTKFEEMFEDLKKKYILIRQEEYKMWVSAYFTSLDYPLVISINRQENSTHVRVLYDINEVPHDLFDYLEKHRKVVDEPNYIYFMVSNSYGLSLDQVEYPRKEINIEDNYNEDFYPLNDSIKEYLESDRSGVHIFHGIPGSGKSSYIKYLINEVNKRFIYCPASIIPHLSSPEFIKIMVREGSGTVLIIEDAEEALVDQGTVRNSAISNILNISDGLIGDTLRIQVIATFNTDFGNIDPAILRKGRLLSLYEFKELNTEKTQKLLNSLGIKDKVTKPMTLADIYNYDSKDYSQKQKVIGL